MHFIKSVRVRDFGAQNGDSIHIKDTDPYSVSAGGALENLDLVREVGSLAAYLLCSL